MAQPFANPRNKDNGILVGRLIVAAQATNTADFQIDGGSELHNELFQAHFEKCLDWLLTLSAEFCPGGRCTMAKKPLDRPGDALLRAKWFREHAKECLKLAKSAHLRETREIYERLAASYEGLAKDMEMIEQRRAKNMH